MIDTYKKSPKVSEIREKLILEFPEKKEIFKFQFVNEMFARMVRLSLRILSYYIKTFELQFPIVLKERVIKNVLTLSRSYEIRKALFKLFTFLDPSK